MAAIIMFLFREGSRNAFNKDRRQETFIKNYERTFGLRLPHMDAVDDVLRALQPDELEKLKIPRDKISNTVVGKHHYF